MGKKCLIVASVASMIGQFNMPNIKLLQSMGYHVTVAANFSFGSAFSEEHSKELWNELIQMNVEVHNIGFSRSVFSKQNISAYKQIKELVSKNSYSLVHCHSPIGGAVTRLAARKSRKHGAKVIYTAHGFHFFKGASKLNWLLYYPAEKILARYTDALITINQEDYRRAKQKIKAKSVYYMHGIGVNTNKFADSNIDRETKRSELGIPSDATVITSIGELNTNKNHQVVIKALGEIKGDNLHYIICGKGDQLENLRELCSSMNLSERVHFLGYRTDIAELLKASDVFVFPSFREGLPVSLMEAMSSGLPCVVSNIRGNTDLIEHEKGGFICEPDSVSEFKNGILRAISEPGLGEYNKATVEKFDISNVMAEMTGIYESMTDS